MNKRIVCILLCVLVSLISQAAVITLKSGKKVTGEVLINNDEVVIIRDNMGARFQYPKADVLSVENGENTIEEEVTREEEQKPQGKKIAFFIGIEGGDAFVPLETNGGSVGGELLIGSRYIGQKSIFLGGGLSVNAIFAGGNSYVFLPLQVAVKVPFLEGKHSPFVGANLGYGFGVSHNCKGGIFTSAEIGYRYIATPRTSLYVGVRAQFQQATATGKVNVEQTTYKNHAGRNFITLGAHFGFTF